MSNEFNGLKYRMFMRVFTTAAVTGAVGLLTKWTLVDGILQEPFANGFLYLAQRFLPLDREGAIMLYHRLFLFNKDTLMTVGFISMLLVFLGVAMARFVECFNQISRGIGGLLDEDGEPVSLPPGLEAMERRLNGVRTELAKRKAEAMESERRKNDLVVYLAHDLKTPLTSIIGYLTLLEGNPDLPPAQRERCVSIPLHKAMELEGLINGFFDITRYSLRSVRLVPTEVNLTFMCRQLADEFQPVLAKRGMVAMVEANGDVVVSGDANLLARVFGNLLTNASVHGYEGSDVRITVESVGDHARVSIRNRGPVIPGDALDNIFEEYYRVNPSNPGGAGLGLAIAKHIVGLHGGSIRAVSNPDFTGFTVSLPTNGVKENLRNP